MQSARVLSRAAVQTGRLFGARRATSRAATDLIAREDAVCAANYRPLQVVLSRGAGAEVWDAAGTRYLDMMSAYSAVSHGHGHPRLLRALREQAARLCIASRAFHTDKLASALERACALTGMDSALPMNTGSEAAETALKAARKWAYDVKGVPDGKAEIIACEGNFHGRTIAIVAMSSEEGYRKGFGPFPGGFKMAPYGDAGALESLITENTAAFVVEPIQGEGGIVIPPEGYLRKCAEICRRHNVLFIADEVQTGLGRTGKLLACHHDGVEPDGLILGKALGGGVLPVSMFLARKDVMDVFTPGTHGSTFGGNPLAAAVAEEALCVLEEEKLTERSAELGEYFLKRLRTLNSPLVKELRGRGLFIGMEIEPRLTTARNIVERLLERGVLSKETHETVVRLAPPLVVSKEQLDWATDQFRVVFDEMAVELDLAA